FPYALYTFTIDYFDLWNKKRRWVARSLALVAVVVAVLYAIQMVTHNTILIKGTFVSSEGLMEYEYGPYVGLYLILLGTAEIGVLLSIWTAIHQYRKKPDKANRGLLIGITFLVIGLFLVPIPGLEHYAFEQILYAAGSLVLAPVVLQQRLF